jgi:hypothetical protein
MNCHLRGSVSVLRALLIRAIFLAAIAFACLLGAPSDNPVAGRWKGHSPDPIGRTEDIELNFTVNDRGLSGVLQTEDHEIPLTKVRLQGRSLTFDATRDLRGRNVLYHYDGTLAGETLDFTVQNDDGSSFFRFVAHRVQ